MNLMFEFKLDILPPGEQPYADYIDPSLIQGNCIRKIMQTLFAIREIIGDITIHLSAVANEQFKYKNAEHFIS